MILNSWASNVAGRGIQEDNVAPEGIAVVPGAGFPSWTKPLTTRPCDAERTPRTLGAYAIEAQATRLVVECMMAYFTTPS